MKIKKGVLNGTIYIVCALVSFGLVIGLVISNQNLSEEVYGLPVGSLIWPLGAVMISAAGVTCFLMGIVEITKGNAEEYLKTWNENIQNAPEQHPKGKALIDSIFPGLLMGVLGALGVRRLGSIGYIVMAFWANTLFWGAFAWVILWRVNERKRK